DQMEGAPLLQRDRSVAQSAVRGRLRVRSHSRAHARRRRSSDEDEWSSKVAAGMERVDPRSPPCLYHVGGIREEHVHAEGERASHQVDGTEVGTRWPSLADGACALRTLGANDARRVRGHGGALAYPPLAWGGAR